MPSKKQQSNAAGRDKNKQRHPPRSNQPRPSGYQTSKTHGTERKGSGQSEK